MLLLRAETYVQYLQYHNTTIIHININPCYIRRNEACMIIYMYKIQAKTLSLIVHEIFWKITF